MLPVALFVASAAFTLWRNTEIAVLVDLAYPLNTATRIALGDVPYAQFPLAQAPLHFLVQAALIKLLGPHYVVQIAYACVVGGAATAIAYGIARHLLEDLVPSPHLAAAVVTLPLVPLGIYAIYPHPFYDPDACLAVLAAIAVIFATRSRPSARRWLVAGALLTLPIWIKQNIGGAFVVSTVAVLAVEAIARPAARPGLRWCAIGLAGAAAIEVAALQIVVGVDSYLRWAWTFALEGRGVSVDRVAALADPRLLLPATAIIVPAALAAILPVRYRAVCPVAALAVLLGALAAAPTISLGPPEMFPPLLLAAVALMLPALREAPTFTTLLPLILLATTAGTLLSQGLYSSSFGIFPLLTVAVASIVRGAASLARAPGRLAPLLGTVLAVLLAVSGTGYTLSNARLRFIDVNAPGPIASSAFPSLVGLSARGPYVPELDALLVWVRDNISPDDPMAVLPGEDPLFYALERKPRLPAVYFFNVASPYGPADTARIASEVGLRWVVVKERLQLLDAPPLEADYVAALTEHATLVHTVGPYRVYRRP